MEFGSNQQQQQRLVVASTSAWPLTETIARLAQDFEVLDYFNLDPTSSNGKPDSGARNTSSQQPAGQSGSGSQGPYQRLLSATASADLLLTFGIFELPSSLTAQVSCTCINVHPTVLPAFKGADALYWAKFNGDHDKLGMSLHVTNGRQAGVRLFAKQQQQPILSSDTEFYRQIVTANLDEIVATLRALNTSTTGEFELDPPSSGKVEFKFPSVSPVFTKKLAASNWLQKKAKLLTKRLLLSTPANIKHVESGVALFAHRILDDNTPTDDWRRVLGYTSKSEIIRLIRELRKHYDLVSIERMTEIVRTGFKIKKPVINLSFDDGYRDVCTNGLEICESEQVPLDLFVSTAVVDGHRPYHQLVYDLVDSVTTDFLSVPCADQRLLFDSSLHRILTAEYVLLPFLKTLSSEDRNRVIRDIQKENQHSDSAPVDEFCTSEDLAAADKSDYFGVHLHGHLHEPFETLSPGDLERDLQNSTQALTRILGRHCSILSYPNGMYHADQLSILSKHKIKWAFTVEDCAINRWYCPPLELPRLGLVNDDVIDTLWRVRNSFEQVVRPK